MQFSDACYQSYPISNVNSNTFHSTQTVRRNVPRLNLLDKFDATIQPTKNSTIHAQLGKKRNAVYAENIINKVCSQKKVVDSTSHPVQSKKTKLVGNLNTKGSMVSSISHSILTNTTESKHVKISRNSISKNKIVATSDVNITSTSHDESSKSTSCSQVSRKRNAEYTENGKIPTFNQKKIPKSNIVSVSQLVHNIINNLVGSFNVTHPTVTISSQDIHTKAT